MRQDRKEQDCRTKNNGRFLFFFFSFRIIFISQKIWQSISDLAHDATLKEGVAVIASGAAGGAGGESNRKISSGEAATASASGGGGAEERTAHLTRSIPISFPRHLVSASSVSSSSSSLLRHPRPSFPLVLLLNCTSHLLLLFSFLPSSLPLLRPAVSIMQFRFTDSRKHTCFRQLIRSFLHVFKSRNDV